MVPEAGGKELLIRKRHCAKRIILLLQEAEVELGKGEKIPKVCRKLGFTRQTHCSWRTKHGSMEPKLVKQPVGNWSPSTIGNSGGVHFFNGFDDLSAAWAVCG